MKLNIYFLNTILSITSIFINNISAECRSPKKNGMALSHHEHYPFSLPDLPYKYNALEPHIDEKTMEIHHTKHHKAYLDNLNNTLKDHPKLHQKSLFELLSQINSYPADIKTALRNNAGGHFNHSLFWTIMRPNSTPISKNLESQIAKDFGSVEAFQNKFNNCAKLVFGSGWAWLVTDKKGNLSIMATHNQDCPISDRLTPILCLDVWEHAYYLKYQNKRVDYIQEFWHVVNWKQVEEYYQQATQKS
jgi:Fe-Mn family superoxide dismutase